jgi:undecaprenyl-diphosphatase
VTDLQALLLGVVQGLTEFLPISSSGHLILVPWLLDFHYLEQHPHFNKTFDVAVHVGTLVAVIVYFRTEIAALTLDGLRSLRKRRIDTTGERLAWLVVVATVPAAFAGAVGESTIEDHLGNPWQIAILLAGFGLLLGYVDRLPQRRSEGDLTWRSAFGIGCAQALALAPGVSRSGVTITAARGIQFTREAAARLSFLLLVPVVAGASMVKGLDVARDGLPPGSTGPVLIGVLAAAVSGFGAIWVLMRYLQTHTYKVFVWYRIGAAIVIMLLIVTGVRPATF